MTDNLNLHSTRPAMPMMMGDEDLKSRIQDVLFRKGTPNLDLLPLMHNTDEERFKEIVTANQLSTEYCKVFKEDLVYFFYGKPAYVLARKVKNRTDSVYYPVCFIVNPNCVEIHRAFPFDSGAFHSRLFRSALHRDSTIDLFELDPNYESIKAYIDEFYGDNSRYLTGESSVATRIDRRDPNSIYQQLARLLHSTIETGYDQGCNTIEVLSKRNYPIKDIVLGTVIPDVILYDNSIMEVIEGWGIEIFDYITYEPSTPIRYLGEIQGIVYRYLMSKNLFLPRKPR